MVAMNIAAFQPLTQFEQRMEEFISEIKSVPLAKGHDEVFYPGEMEANNDVRNRREGLQLPEDTVVDFRRMRKKRGWERNCHSSRGQMPRASATGHRFRRRAPTLRPS